MQSSNFLICSLVIIFRLVDSTLLHTTLTGRKGSPLIEHARSINGASTPTDIHTRSLGELGGTMLTPNKDSHNNLTLLESFASSLKTWGSQSPGSSVPHDVEHFLNTRDMVKDLHVDRAHHTSSLPRSTALLLVVAFLLTCMTVACGCFGRWWDDDDETSRGPDPTLAAVESCDSSWAKAYREADGRHREAIELLFRCNIITMPEFAYGKREADDIRNCVRIGVSMLEERSLSQWESRWQEACHTFEKKAAAP